MSREPQDIQTLVPSVWYEATSQENHEAQNISSNHLILR